MEKKKHVTFNMLMALG